MIGAMGMISSCFQAQVRKLAKADQHSNGKELVLKGNNQLEKMISTIKSIIGSEWSQYEEDIQWPDLMLEY